MASFGSLKSEIFDREERKQQYQAQIRGLNAHDRHKKFLKDYVAFYGKEKPMSLKLPVKTDQDTLREGFRFIRSEEDDKDSSWEQRLVKRYYDKLFKEYPLQVAALCISQFFEYLYNQLVPTIYILCEYFLCSLFIALTLFKILHSRHVTLQEWQDWFEMEDREGGYSRERASLEVLNFSFISLNNFQVNFTYVEAGENKQALVKLVTCERCAEKLHYKRRKEKEQLDRREKEENKRKRYQSRSDHDTDEEYEEREERRKISERRDKKEHKRKREISLSDDDTEEKHDRKGLGKKEKEELKRNRDESGSDSDSNKVYKSSKEKRKERKASSLAGNHSVNNDDNFDEFMEGMFP
ncbi:Folate-sensitive fragile site protein [Citrus sinensis]|uniref:Folate-sensitive fragile site protein n=1 Tax=Citrus sinensis TaxID=2711 RepID=A0ACB8LM96_CITSI|nr:Folate-sensitive fragile site protein [Citrus sinensis]